MLAYVVFQRMELITKMRLNVYLIKPINYPPYEGHYDGVLNFDVSFGKILILEGIITVQMTTILF